MNEMRATGAKRQSDQTYSASTSLREHESEGCAGERLCPLHFAMQQLAYTAVSQFVFYAEGEYTPRPDLLEDLVRWERLHRLIACRICPALRIGGNIASALDAALALLPEAQFHRQRQMLARCASCDQQDACPLESESDLHLFASHYSQE